MTTKPAKSVPEPEPEPELAEPEMIPAAALSILVQAAHEYKGTRADHLMIDRAVQVLTEQLERK